MSIVKNENIAGMQNIERDLEKFVFKPVGKHDLERVEHRGNDLILYFDENENPSAKNFLKQMSVKKYKEKAKEKCEREGKFESKCEGKDKSILEEKLRAEAEDMFIRNFEEKNCQTHLVKIQTEKYTLFFFSEKC